MSAKKLSDLRKMNSVIRIYDEDQNEVNNIIISLKDREDRIKCSYDGESIARC